MSSPCTLSKVVYTSVLYAPTDQDKFLECENIPGNKSDSDSTFCEGQKSAQFFDLVAAELEKH